MVVLEEGPLRASHVSPAGTDVVLAMIDGPRALGKLAAELGASRSKLNRELQVVEDQGIIDFSGAPTTVR